MTINTQEATLMIDAPGFPSRRTLEPGTMLKWIAIVVIFVASLFLLLRPINVEQPIVVVTPVQIQQLRAALAPLLAQLHKADKQAEDNLQQAIQHDFVDWQSRVQGFVENVNSMGSQLGLLGVAVWDGTEVMAIAVQVLFQEQVVSPVQLQMVVQSHLVDFHQELAINRQEFHHKFGRTMDEINFPPVVTHWIQQRLHQTRQQQLILANDLAVQAAVTPIVSASGAYLSQRFMMAWLTKRPVALGASSLLKAAKSNVYTAIVALGVDYMIGDMLEKEMLAEVLDQMRKSEQVLQYDLHAYASQQIQVDESKLNAMMKSIPVEVKQ